MNAKEISPKVEVRLQRIKFVSRIAKYICFGFLLFSIGFNLLFFAPKATFWRELLLAGFQIILWAWYWKLSRVFRFYERGMIFAAETIRSIKTLGLLWVMGWLLLTVLHFSPPTPTQIQAILPSSTTSSDGTTRIIKTHVTRTHYQMGFFTFNFGTGIDFGPLLAGAVIILIAWIMDEGRKIQEEQALTV
ncbi:MAG: DUF2975 domain-containing protein [Verrucomicrobiota bacterium]